MKPFKTVTTLAVLLLVAASAAASAQDIPAASAQPAFRPGWRHEQMMQARAQGQALPVAGQPGPGMGYGMGWGGGPPLRADGTIDTARLPDGCPLKTLPQTR